MLMVVTLIAAAVGLVDPTDVSAVFAARRAEVGERAAALLAVTPGVDADSERRASLLRFASDWATRGGGEVFAAHRSLLDATERAVSRLEAPLGEGRSWARGGEHIPGAIVNPLTGELGPSLLRFWWMPPAGFGGGDPGLARPSSGWPLVVFLHGAGGARPEMTAALFSPVRSAVEGGLEIPAVVVMPKCDGVLRWEPRLLDALLDWCLANLEVDPDRVLVTGIGMGGTGVWEWAFHSPARAAGLAPFGGGANPLGVQRITHIAVRSEHGVRDGVVDFHRADVLRAMSERIGATSSTFIARPGAGHAVWGAYAEQGFWDWLLAQRRRAVRTAPRPLLFDADGLGPAVLTELPPGWLVGTEVRRGWDEAEPRENAALVRPYAAAAYASAFDAGVGRVVLPWGYVERADGTLRLGVHVEGVDDAPSRFAPASVWASERGEAVSVLFSGRREDVGAAAKLASVRAASALGGPVRLVFTGVWDDGWHDGRCLREFWFLSA